MLVCAPGLAHRRLTPSNNDELLFDDVMWVENAQRDHADFVNKMTQRGVEVVELHDVLARAMQVDGARDWLLDRKITANQVGLGLVDGTRAFLENLDPRQLAEYLIGGLATNDLPDDYRSGYISLARESAGAREYLMPPLPNTLYTRDTTCWLYGGLTMNPLYWPRPQGRDADLQGDLRVPPRLRRLDRVVGRPGGRTGARPPSRAATSCRSATEWC